MTHWSCTWDMGWWILWWRSCCSVLSSSLRTTCRRRQHLIWWTAIQDYSTLHGTGVVRALHTLQWNRRACDTTGALAGITESLFGWPQSFQPPKAVSLTASLRLLWWPRPPATYWCDCTCHFNNFTLFICKVGCWACWSASAKSWSRRESFYFNPRI